MNVKASQTTDRSIVRSTAYLNEQRRKHQCSASPHYWLFATGIRQWSPRYLGLYLMLERVQDTLHRIFSVVDFFGQLFLLVEGSDAAVINLLIGLLCIIECYSACPLIRIIFNEISADAHCIHDVNMSTNYRCTFVDENKKRKLVISGATI